MRKKKIFITAISFLLSFIMAGSNIMVVFAEDAIKNGDDEIKLERELDELIKDDEKVSDSAGFVLDDKQVLEEEISNEPEEFIESNNDLDTEEEQDPEVEEAEVKEPKVEEPKGEESKTAEIKAEKKDTEAEIEETREIEIIDEKNIIERPEQYPDMLGEPKLVFPNTRFRTMGIRSAISDTIEVDKTAVRSPGCRTFEVTLDITGTPQEAPVDVVLVIDRSGSMSDGNVIEYVAITSNPSTNKSYYVKVAGEYKVVSYSSGYIWQPPQGWYYGSGSSRRYVTWNANGDDNAPGGSSNNPVGKPFYESFGRSRMYLAKQAAVNFAAKVLGPGGVPGSRVSIVSYAGPTTTSGSGSYGVQGHARTDQDLTSDISLVNAAIAGLSANGGTNTEAGFIEAKKVIQDTVSNQNPNSSKVVIMFTDGMPTSSNGNAYGPNDPTSHNNHTIAAYTAGQDIYNNGIADVFTVGLFEGMTGAVYNLAVNTLTRAQNKGFYDAPTAGALDGIFTNISTQLGYAATQAKVVDKLGDNFELVPGTLTGGTYNEATREITWNPGTIYNSAQLKYIIQAKSTFTGGMEEEDKVFANEYANLTYTDVFGTPNKTKIFPKPKVNVPTIIEISLTDATIVSGDSISLGTGTDPLGENYMSPVTGGDNDGINFTYEWRKVGDDTVIATDKNPSVSPVEDTKYEVTVTDSNGCKAVATMWVRVTKKFDIGIKKIADKGTHQELLDGAKFVLKDEDEVEVKSGITVDGYLWMNDLLPGTYTLEEAEAPVGYKLNPQSYTITISENGDITVDPNLVIETEDDKKVLVVENEEQITITANKVWSTGFNEKPTIKFQLYRNGILVEGSVKSLIYPNQILEWQYLDATDDNGVGYEYTVKEVYEDNGKITLEGLEYDVQYSEDFLTVTNTLKNGELEITKKVTGNSGNLSTEFDIKVTFELPEGKTLSEGYNIEVDSSEVIWNGLTATIKLKHGESLTFSNIPYGVTYTVVESNYEGYDEPDYDIQDENGEINVIDSEKETVLITNNKDVIVDTGISMDSLPYMLILGVVLTGTIGWFIKRRKSINFY